MNIFDRVLIPSPMCIECYLVLHPVQLRDIITESRIKLINDDWSY